MDNINEIEQKIIELRDQGLGRTRIARQLGVSEYKVRTTIRADLTNKIHEHEVAKKEESKELFSKTKIRLNLPWVDDKPKVKKTAILSDIHIPYHCHTALGVAYSYLKDYQPDQIILNGDVIDNYSCSSYRKDESRLVQLQDELNETKAFLGLLRTTFPNAEIFYTNGNHEQRTEKTVMDKAPALATLDALAIDELLELRKYDIKFVDTSSEVLVGDIEVYHGEICRKGAGASARAHHEKTGVSTLIGHVHKLAVLYKTNKVGTHVMIENGHLAREDCEYMKNPDWQQGFTCIETTEDGHCQIKQHHIKNGALLADGRLYTI